MNQLLSIENLSNAVQVDEAPGAGPMSDLRVSREMRNNGLEAPVAQPQGGGTVSFGKLLEDSLDKVNTLQSQADTAIKELVAGRTKNIHETMLAIERADSSLKLMMQVRNKILDAYREIIRMQV